MQRVFAAVVVFVVFGVEGRQDKAITKEQEMVRLINSLWKDHNSPSLLTRFLFGLSVLPPPFVDYIACLVESNKSDDRANE